MRGAEGVRQGASEDRPGGREPAVLVVDDDRACRELCARTLELRGLRVLQAGTARAALSLYQVHLPAVVVCDIRLPDPGVRRELLAACADPAAGCGLVQISAGAAARESADVLRKPFTAAALVEAVDLAFPGDRRAVPGESGVRDEALPPPSLLAPEFCAALLHDVRLMDRALTAGRRHRAREILHRLQGGAAMTGHPGLAAYCSRLDGYICGDPPEPGWINAWIDLLRAAEDVLDGREELRRRERGRASPARRPPGR